MERLKLAIIGCGAVTERSHLPALARLPDVEVVALVDQTPGRAQKLAEKHCQSAAALEDCRQIFGKAEAAIVAVPNALHKSVAIELMDHGLHVLVEKPMAIASADCQEMVRAAGRNRVVLTVGMVRRFYGSSRFVRQAMAEGILGQLRSFDWREGAIFDWPVASGAIFRKEVSGGGALMDVGIHVLDLLGWWLGDLEPLAYCDDSFGGVEADCEVHLRCANGAKGVVELSRMRKLRNTCILQGERGTITLETGFGGSVQLEFPGVPDALLGAVAPSSGDMAPLMRAFCDQFTNFAGAVRRTGEPLVAGREGSRAVSLVERCYRMRQPLDQPWLLLHAGRVSA